MICPMCNGTRKVLCEHMDDAYSKFFYPVLCPYCEGQGSIHCCEGMQAQPDCSPTNTPFPTATGIRQDIVVPYPRFLERSRLRGRSYFTGKIIRIDLDEEGWNNGEEP
jgi:hypothetical protein